jgi:hypothetical protein
MAAHSREPTLAKARRLTNRPGDDKGGGGARGALTSIGRKMTPKTQLSKGHPRHARPRAGHPGGAFRDYPDDLALDAWVDPRIMIKLTACYLHPCIA